MVAWIPIIVGLIIGGLVVATILPQITQPPPEGGGDFTQMLNQLMQMMFLIMFVMMMMNMMMQMMG
jgi:hypothetical protein